MKRRTFALTVITGAVIPTLAACSKVGEPWKTGEKYKPFNDERQRTQAQERELRERATNFADR
jgi:hypothetical protein